MGDNMKSRELVTLPLIIFIFSIFVYLISEEITHPFLKILIPQNDNALELSKVFFTTFLIIYFGIFLFDNQEINNYLLSRVISLLIMIIISIFLYHFLPLKGHLKLIVMMIIAVFSGQYVSLRIQMLKIKNSDTLALIIQSLISLFISYITFNPISL